MRNLESVSAYLASPILRLNAHLSTPLYRNGYSLVLSSAVGSGLGTIYWIVAARAYSPEILGGNSAAIAAMMFLAGVAQLNLVSALVRFLPQAGSRTATFVLVAFGIATIGAALASTVFLMGLSMWAPSLGFLRANLGFSLWFILATIAWTIYVLQEGVLTGLRQATWVPVKNAVFAVSKLALLAGFAVLLPAYGVFSSWTVALVVVLPVNWLVFCRLIPKHIQATEAQACDLDVAQIARYVSGDYFGALCWVAATTLLPVVVTNEAGATAAAYFYLPWQVALLLLAISPNMGSSLVVEAAFDNARLRAYSYSVLLSTMRMVGAGVVVVVAAAPYIMRVFGEGYETESTTLLRLLALAAVPNVLTSLSVSVARAQRRIRVVASTMALLCVLALAMSHLLLRISGITGVGAGWLIAQTIVAVVAFLVQLRPLWFSQEDDMCAVSLKPLDGAIPNTADSRGLLAPPDAVDQKMGD